MLDGLGEAMVMLAYMAVFGLVLTVALIVGSIASIFLPIPLWALIGGAIGLGMLTSFVAVGMAK